MTHRVFRIWFDVDCHGSVPDERTIIRYVLNFRETGSVLKRKSSNRTRTARTPENMNASQSRSTEVSQRSAGRYPAAQRMSDRSIQKILHKSLRLYPYKMMMIHTGL